MSIFKCKMCGGTLEINEAQSTAVCEYCGTVQTLPKLGNEQRENLYDRANHFRRSNEFDKAAAIYERILDEDPTDAEAYWSLVLCRYGIEYVEDPVTHKRVPTVNRTQFTSIFDDENYKSALQCADGAQRAIYEEEANTINEIQKGILSISQHEEPFDVFICYKETDANGRRTPDSVLANELYHELTEEGFKVFFARITLEDKIGTAYEPYIFAALNSAKVMVVLGTKPEYFNAVWVKNEWSRYLTLIKSGEKKVLIPAYRDMDPYDLPEEFSHLQAQDMAKLGFMQDLVRGIKKLTESDEPTTTATEQVNVVVNLSGLLKRMFLFLEDGEFEEADAYCEKILDNDPENDEAYLGKLMAAYRCRTRQELEKLPEPFDSNKDYQKILRFGSEALKTEVKGYVDSIKARNESERLDEIYTGACDALRAEHITENRYREIARRFESIAEYKDAQEKAQECIEKAELARKNDIFNRAVSAQQTDTIPRLTQAVQMFEAIPGFLDADERAAACKARIEELKILKQKEEAEQERLLQEKQKKEKKERKITWISVLIGLVCLGCVIAFNSMFCSKSPSQEESSQEVVSSGTEVSEPQKEDTVSSDIGGSEIEEIGLTGKLTFDSGLYVVGAGDQYTVGLKADGTVVAVGSSRYGQCDVSDWTNIVAIETAETHTVGLKSNGTVVATGSNREHQCDVSDWRDIVAISAGLAHTVGVKSDGTVVAIGRNYEDECDVGMWRDIKLPE